MDALSKLGLDLWGILLYLVNFGILLFFMHRFVYRPLISAIEKRRQTIHDDVTGAKRIRSELEEQRAKQDDVLKKRELEFEQRILSAKKSVREEAKTLLAQAESERDAILEQASRSADERVEGVIAGSEVEILKRVNAVVKHVLQDVVSDKEIEKSVTSSWSRLTK